MLRCLNIFSLNLEAKHIGFVLSSSKCILSLFSKNQYRIYYKNLHLIDGIRT